MSATAKATESSASTGRWWRNSPGERKDLIYAKKNGMRYVTMQAWKDADNKLVWFVRDGRGTCKKLWKAGVKLDESLDAEQRKAALKMLNSRDG